MPDTPRTQLEFVCLQFVESEFPHIPVDLTQCGVPKGCLDAFFLKKGF
jgi:hypothetical protein